MNCVFNPGAIELGGKYYLVARVEGNDRKSFFAIAESETGIDNFRFWEKPIVIPETEEPDTNIYDMRVVKHEDGYIYGLFCTERKDPAAAPGDLSSAIAQCGIVRTTDLSEPWRKLYQPGGYIIAPEGEERVGDVSNVVFCNGVISNSEGKVFIYYASSDTRCHVATTSLDRLIDYVKNTPEDALRSFASVQQRIELIGRNNNLC